MQSESSTKLQLLASLDLKDVSTRIKLAKSRDIDMNDPAILALQASMAQVKEQKDANQYAHNFPGTIFTDSFLEQLLSILRDYQTPRMLALL